MRLRDFFSRNNKITLTKTTDKVFFETSEIQTLITDWCNKSGFNVNDFSTLVENIGVKTPILLSNLKTHNADEHSVKCYTDDNKKITIRICYNAWYGISEIWITDKEKTKRYFIDIYFSKNIKPCLFKEILSRKSKKLSTQIRTEMNENCRQYFCQRILKIDNHYTLEVSINEPYISSKVSEFSEFRNYKEVNQYLLSLDSDLVVLNVYNKLMELLEFTDEDILNSGKILISFTETVGTENVIRGKILKQNGQTLEYATVEHGETFHVSRDGKCKYFYNNISIAYNHYKKSYTLSITGDETCILSVNPAKVLKRVKKRFSQLMDFVK